MIRSLMLASTALVLVSFSPANAQCVADASGIACTGDATGPFVEDRDFSIITVDPGATVTAPNNTFGLIGDGIFVDNRGAVTSTDGGSNIRTFDVQGSDAIITNGGSISASDRAIEVTEGPGFLTVINEAGAEITSRRQTIRSLEDFTAATIYNDGLISSQDGRAAQVRSAGSAVFNTGVMTGGEEVIEGREDFLLENDGTINIRGLSWDATNRTASDDGTATTDQDGVQFASGEVQNRGVILGTDDGIDADEGLIHNHATGVIVSLAPDDIRNSAAVDLDGQFEPSTGSADFRPSGPTTIINEGYMEGGRGITTAEDSEAVVSIFNSGVIVGRSGVAIDMSQDQGDTLVELTGGGQIFGDILFGAGGQNTLVFGDLTDGAGIFSEVSARTGGTFDVVFDGMDVSDILAFQFIADLFRLDIVAGAGSFRFNARGANSFTLAGQTYDPQAFAAYLGANGVAPIPLPAAGWMLLAGLGGLVAMRRRAA
jgi:hypothetical protein